MKELMPLRSLSELMNKKIRITCKDGRVIEGETDSFCDMFELEEQQELIVLKLKDGTTDGAFSDEIASVVELDR